MRVAVLTSLYPSPHAPFEGIFAARKWEGLKGRGHDVRAVVPLPFAPRSLASLMSEERARVARAPRHEVRGGIEVVRPRYLHIPTRATGNAARFTKAALAAIDASKPADVVVLDYAWPAAAAAPALRDLGLPTVINGRGSDVLQVQDVAVLRPLLAGGLSAAHALTAVSQDLLDAMCALREPHASGAPAVLTPNGVDQEHFSPGDRQAARRSLGLSEESDVVLVVGHLIERKDPLLALRSFHAASRPAARLVFVGRGPLEESLRAEAERLGLGDRVDLMGERPPKELVAWYRAANVLLLTSSREGRPNVVLEALSTGCPVLATDAGGTAEVIPEPARMLSRSRAERDIGEMLARLLDDPPAAATLRASVGPLSWSASLDALESLLESLIS